MKLVFFNRFFYPDNSATSQLLSDLAFYLATRGHQVHVVTTGVAGSSSSLDTVAGVTIHRVSRAASREATVLSKGLDYLRYIAGARHEAKQLLDRHSVCIVKTDPPLLASAIGGIATRAGAPLVIWLQDVFPEVAQRFGIPGMRGPLGQALRRLRDASLRKASRVVVIGESMRSMMSHSTGLAPSSIAAIHNWADGQAIVPVAHEQNRLRQKWIAPGKFVVGYSGNLGRVHEFETLLGAAERLSSDPSIQFLIVGNGPRLEYVRQCVERRGLRNVDFQALQPRSELALSLGVPDVHIAILRPEFEGLVHPSKVYGIMAAGRPMIFVGDPAGEAARMVAAHDFGFAVGVGDVHGLASVIISLKESPLERFRMGANARSSFDSLYDMRLALARWEALLSEAGDGTTVACYDPTSR